MTYPPGPGQYAPQPQYPGQSAAPKKKTGLWIGLGVFALVVVVALGVGLAVATRPGGSGSAGGRAALTGRPASDYAALLPKQEDYGSDWSVSDDSAPDSTEPQAAAGMLSSLTATPPGCGLSDLMAKSKSLSDKHHKLAGVKGTRQNPGSPGRAGDVKQLSVAITDAGSYDEAVRTLRDYIAKCSSSTMQGETTKDGVPVVVVMTISFTEAKPPQVEADKSFGAQMKMNMSVNAGAQHVVFDQFAQFYAVALRGVVVTANTTGPDQVGLMDKLFAATVDRTNKAS
ncbi:MAG: hypothetical protein ACRC20_13095 [Segniliparus sp.]|uniref:hypothetical protein n=1 Tax=Segniliparus sp. TaxID=2804064 RepID=UPI003F37C277